MQRMIIAAAGVLLAATAQAGGDLTDERLLAADGADWPRKSGNARAHKNATYSRQYFNMLFLDGSARPVSVKEGWNAIRNPGFDTTAP